MAKFFSLAAAAALLLTSTFAHEGHEESSNSTAVTKECAANVTAAAVAVIDNSTYLNTCSPGSTWKLTSLFEAANLSSSDFFTFCNATDCMHPLHELLDELPTDCVSTYNGSQVVLANEVDDFHEKCHALLNAAKSGSEGSGHHHDEAGSTSNSSSSAVSTPAPTKSSATMVSVSSKSLAALITVTVTLAAFVV